MGEIDTGLIGGGVDGEITVYDKSNQYPDSLGLIYSAVTFYLGWKHHCDEGIIMGLAPFGDYNAVIPGTGRTYLSVFDEIIQETGKYSYKIDLSWIAYHQERDKWVSDKFKALLGPKRDWHDPLTAHHKNIAAALQKRLETVVLAQLRLARKEFGFNKLALSGGVCLNCSMNGKVEAARIFDEIYVQPASGDNGVCIGACKLAHKEMTGSLKPEKEHNAYLGSRFTNDEIEETLKKSGVKHAKSDDIFTLTAQKLAEGKIVGWFQGAAEFGPRALGNRSILVKPWPADMRDYLNKRVKFREEFRPFAPAVLKERSKEYFQLAQESPHMLIACQVVPAAKDKIPAVVHVDDSCRAQTVGEENNPRFRKLLEAFDKITGCPVILNTSFNVKGQPIVNTPKHALDCFLSTNIDFLALGDFYCEK
jgi:carbamoyltransferase